MCVLVVVGGQTSFLQSRTRLCLTALICCRSEPHTGAAIAAGCVSLLSAAVCLQRAEPLRRAHARFVRIPGRSQPGSQEHTALQRRMGINREKSRVRSGLTLGPAQRSPESVAEGLFASVSHHYGNRRAEKSTIHVLSRLNSACL